MRTLVRCPFCGLPDTKVLDSRTAEDGDAIRRRRQCPRCRRRFTTFERAVRAVLYVIKRDGRREAFDRAKILTGMLRACEGRPVPRGALEHAAEEIEREVQDRGIDVQSRDIGDRVIERLRHIDDVAYVRFASVYRRLADVDRLVEEIQRLKARKQLEAELRSQIELISLTPQDRRQN